MNAFQVGDIQVTSKTVARALSTMPELSQLRADQYERLTRDIVDAINFASLGCPRERPDVAHLNWVRAIFLADISRALRGQDLPVTTSCGYLGKDGTPREALVFRVTREMARLVRVEVAGKRSALYFPVHPFRLMKSSQAVEYLGATEIAPSYA